MSYIRVKGLPKKGGDIVLEYSNRDSPREINNNYSTRVSYMCTNDFIQGAYSAYYYFASPRYDTETIKYNLVKAVIRVNDEELTVGDDIIDFSWGSDWGYPEYDFKLKQGSPFEKALLLDYTIKADPAYNAVLFTRSSTTDSTQINAFDYGTVYNPVKLYAQGGGSYAKLKSGYTINDVEIAYILQGGSDHQPSADAMKALNDGFLELTTDEDGYIYLGLKREYSSRLWSICAVLLRVKPK